MKSINELIVYFAKFPAKAVALDNFRRTTEKHSGYNNLKTAIENIPAHVFTDIDDYVISSSEKEISERLKSGKDFFLLVEYGPMEATKKNNAGVREIGWQIMVTVGYKTNNANTDSMEEALLMDICRERLFTILETMETDNQERCGFNELLAGKIDIGPVEPLMLYGCLGWQLKFHNALNGAF